MKIAKQILTIILILSFYLIFNTVKADTLSGTGGIGSAGVGTTTGKSGSWDKEYGFYIAVFDGENKQKHVETITIMDYTKTLIPGWITFGSSPTTDPTKLYDYLDIPYGDKTDDYAKLKTYISGVNLNKGDYIIVEPFTKIGDAWNTFRSIISNNTESTYVNSKNENVLAEFWNWYNKAAILMANAAKVGTDITVGGNTFTAPTNNCDSSNYWNNKFCGWKNNKHIGYGLVIVKYENIFGDLQLTKKDKSTQSVIKDVGFTLYSDSSCTKTLKNQTFTNSEGVVIFSSLDKGNVYYKETTTPSDYIADSNCHKINIIAGETKKKTVYNSPVTKKGNLTINIKIKGTDTLITSSNATFEIRSGSNCNGNLISTVTTSMGSLTTELDAGTYSIKETAAPNGYVDSNPKCVKTNVNIVVGDRTTENIFYDAECGTKLKNLGDNPTVAQLFNLYKDYPHNTNLLNLLDPSCTASNCGNNDLTLGCLSGSTNTSEFNHNNLSCYNSDPLTDSYGNYIGFCQTSYGLTNNLGVNKFYAKSGRLLIEQNENIITIFEKNELNELNVLTKKTIENEFLATGATKKVCYSLNQLNSSNINQISEYNVYFGDNDNNNIADDLMKIENNIPESYTITENGLNSYEFIKINNYKFKPMYLEKLSGKYSSTKTSSTISEPIYGLLSRFDKKSGIIPFKVNNKSSNSCTFEAEQEIIKGKMNLEFRIIDTKNPFNRNTMSNWSNGTDNSKDNDTVTEYIKDAVNSYGLDKYGTKVDPIYKIILTPDDIKEIRKYNKENPYDNYLTVEVEYGANKVFRNSFLYSLEKGMLNDKPLNNKLYNFKYPI